MYVEFKTLKLKKQCEDINLARRQWGEPVARKIIQRINELIAAERLCDISHLPPTRCHALTHNRKGQFAVDLTGQLRLVFQPINDDGLVLTGVEPLHIYRVKILEVIDYHE